MNFVVVRYNNGNYTILMDNDINDSFVLPENAISFTHYLQDKHDEQGCNLWKTVIIGSLVKCIIADMCYNISNEEAQKNPDDVYIKYKVNGKDNYCQPSENITLVNSFEELESNFTKEFETSKKIK